MKDKEPRVHIEHYFDIDSLENVGYIIKAHLMLCVILHFREDPKVYSNEDNGGHFVGKVLGILVKLTTEMIAQAIGCKRRITKFVNN